MPVRFLAKSSLIMASLLGAWTASSANEILSSYQLKGAARSTMDKVADRFEIVNRKGDAYEVYVPAEKTAEFLTIAPTAKLLNEDVNEEIRALDASLLGTGYRNYDQVVEHLQELAQAHPDILSLESYGTSSQGRELYVLKLSDNVKQDEDGEPRLMLDAATHGDEVITVEVLLNLIDELVDGYGTDERLTAMVNQTALYFVPMVNADGFAMRSRYADGVDPNRAYPWPEQPNRRVIKPIKAIMDLVEKNRFDGSMDFHAYGQMLMYPWAYTYQPLGDRDDLSKLDTLTTFMAEDNGYRHGPISRVIYVAKGSSADYYYWKFKTAALAVELSSNKAPGLGQISQVTDEAREMTWRFIEHFAKEGRRSSH